MAGQLVSRQIWYQSDSSVHSHTLALCRASLLLVYTSTRVSKRERLMTRDGFLG